MHKDLMHGVTLLQGFLQILSLLRLLQVQIDISSIITLVIKIGHAGYPLTKWFVSLSFIKKIPS